MTSGKTVKSKGKSAAKDKTGQLQRFRKMARELGADESADAMDRAFGRLNPKKKAPAK